MIDTVIISIPQNEYRSRKDYKGNFGWKVVGKNLYIEKFLLSSSDIKCFYMPKIFKIKNGKYEYLKIEFSAPKVLFGNNLEEIRQVQFIPMLKVLQLRIFQMGVYIPLENLSKSSVSAVHIGKNINLTNGYTSSYVIKELSKISINKRFDLNKTDFRNSGEGFQIYTKQHSIVFYDKSLEILRDKKVTEQLVDKGIFEQKTSNILRLEIRLSSSRKVKQILRLIDRDNGYFLQDIFDDDLCAKILNYYWKTMVFEQNKTVFSRIRTAETKLAFLLYKYPEIKPKELIYFLGLQTIGMFGNSFREIRAIFDRKFSQRTWYRITSDLKKINSISDYEPHEWVKQIESQINVNSP